MLYLGLDISTSIVGISVIDKDLKLIEMNHIDLRKTKCIFEKAKKVEEVLENIFEYYTISAVAIEDTLQSFSRGLSSARTLMQLSRFNGIVSNISYRLSGLIPEYINVNTCRKILKIKIDKNSDIDKKEQLVNWVDEDLKGYKWPKRTILRGKAKGLIKLEKFCYDMADAYIVCKSYIVMKFYNDDEQNREKT